MSRKEADKKYDEKRASKRSRNWAFLVYPESAPENWIQIIENEMTPFVVSPIHDSDINELTGKLKKAHFHVLITYSSVKTFEQVKELTDSLKTTIPQMAKNLIGAVRYMAHLDNPDKAQYQKSDIKAYCGFDLESVFKLSATDKKQISKDILNYIMENEITEYFILVKYALEHNDDWYDYLSSNSYMIMNFIKSLRHFKQEQNLRNQK